MSRFILFLSNRAYACAREAVAMELEAAKSAAEGRHEAASNETYMADLWWLMAAQEHLSSVHN